MFFSRINGVVHHYLTAGKTDAPPLVFANSLGTDLRIWHSFAEQLAGSFETVRYDKRGHGLSQNIDPPYSINDLSEDLARLLDILEINQAVVCGISVGGLIAQALALSHPKRVRALVLCDTGARIGSFESWQQRIEIVRSGGLKALESAMMERWFSVGFRARCPDAITGYAKMLRQTSPEGYIGTCYALRDADFRESISSVYCPTLVLTGAEDVATPPELGRELASSIRGAKFSAIEYAGHLACVEQPEIMAKRMMNFFREVKIV